MEERPWPDGMVASVEPEPLATRAGAGRWGTAFSLLFARHGWNHFKQVHHYGGMLSAARPANTYIRSNVAYCWLALTSENLLFAPCSLGMAGIIFKEVHHYGGMLSAARPADTASATKWP